MFRRKKSLNVWESVADMMTGLMVLFLFICLAYTFQLQQQQQREEAAVSEYFILRKQIYEELIEEIPPEQLTMIGVSVDDRNISVDFVDPLLFFDKGSSAIKPELRRALGEFIPHYMKVLEKYGNEIAEVRIEGNASHDYGGDINSPEAYFYNMKLSQDRAYNVLHLIYNIDAVSAQRPWLAQKFRAVGASFSQASMDHSQTSDVKRYRCVSFNVRLDAEGRLRKMLDDLSTIEGKIE